MSLPKMIEVPLIETGKFEEEAHGETWKWYVKEEFDLSHCKYIELRGNSNKNTE